MARERNRVCIIVGAGVSGLVQAAEILRKDILQPEELEILDRSKDYGGVWNAAIYPGAGCDVFSVLYQVSWFRKADWGSFFPRGGELADYFRKFAEKFKLRSCTTFDANVIEAVWSDEKMAWTVITEDAVSRQRTTWTTKILIYAPGTYNRSVTPDISGISSFKGEMWHTYNWPADADLSGKVVAYIGTGPSAVQILPSIQPAVKSLKVYVRSMTYCLPMSNATNTPAIQFLKKWVPGLLSVYAFVLGCIFGLWTYYLFRPGSWVARSAEWYCTKFFEQEVRDPILRDKLRPKGRIGDKRPLVSRNFYQILQKPNVDVITDSITLVDEKGIVSTPSRLTANDNLNRQAKESSSQNSLDISLNTLTPKGIHNDVDVIIWGTGFKMQGWGTAFKIVGRHGKALGEHWGGAPQTLYGMATSEFPNLLFVSGPNTVAPWASIISGIEIQALYNNRVIREIKKRSVNGRTFAIMPRVAAETQYTEALQPELEKLATSLEFGPRNYYVSEEGRNTFFFPFTQMYYRWLLRSINWDNYITVDDQEIYSS
ncbi:hypothetical protein V501_00155 [Pseudogymnoascus sp. VKM F-4519 (FW-2642)]|nr:hypothetical protein V501_00155 [Pseudogymnoascus sp. VKM F-4519 (FW-2642)]